MQLENWIMNWDNAHTVGPKISKMSFFFQLSFRASFMSVSDMQAQLIVQLTDRVQV